MPTYVIERDMPGAQDWSEEQIQSASKQSLDALQHLGIQWMHSYVTDDKVYCIYWAPGEDVIQQHADRLGLPANRIAAVRRLLGPQTSE